MHHANYGILMNEFLIFAEMRRQFKCLDGDKIILIFSCKHSQHQDISGLSGVVYICHAKIQCTKFLHFNPTVTAQTIQSWNLLYALSTVD
jgi:hypothetical protein